MGGARYTSSSLLCQVVETRERNSANHPPQKKNQLKKKTTPDDGEVTKEPPGTAPKLSPVLGAGAEAADEEPRAAGEGPGSAPPPADPSVKGLIPRWNIRKTSAGLRSSEKPLYPHLPPQMVPWGSLPFPITTSFAPPGN